MKAAEAEEDATIELTAAERRAQRKAEREAREAKTETVAVEPEPEVTVDVVDPGFNGFDTQNADFGTMPTPFATDFGTMPQTDANGFPDFGTISNADGNNYDAFVRASVTSDPERNRLYGPSPGGGQAS